MESRRFRAEQKNILCPVLKRLESILAPGFMNSAYFAVMLGLPRIPVGHEQGNSTVQWIRKTCSNEKAVTWQADCGKNANYCQPALSSGLEVFWNRKL